MNRRAIYYWMAGLSPIILITGIGASSISADESFLPFLFSAYTISWIGFFTYAFFLHKKQNDLYSEIQGVKRSLDKPPSDPEITSR